MEQGLGENKSIEEGHEGGEPSAAGVAGAGAAGAGAWGVGAPASVSAWGAGAAASAGDPGAAASATLGRREHGAAEAVAMASTAPGCSARGPYARRRWSTGSEESTIFFVLEKGQDC